VAGKHVLTYLQLYPDDLLAQVFRNGEPPDVTGARVRLWCVACGMDPVGTLPTDEAQLQQWSGLDGARWSAAGKQILSGWQLRGGRWHIRRIKEQFAKRTEIAEKRSRAARTRWSAQTPAREDATPDDQDDGDASAGACASRLHDDMQCSPTPTPAPSPTPAVKRKPAWLTTEEKERLAALVPRLNRKYPRDWPRFQQLLARWRRERRPWPPVEQALESALENDARNLCAYLTKILKVEEPNHNERQAIARHSETKEVRGSGLRVDGGMETVGSVLRRAMEGE
jgi:hypothetical protein